MENLNVTQNVTATKFIPTTGGILFADFNMILMSVVSIYMGSRLSIHYHKKQKESGEENDFITHKDAMMFPLTASATLLGLYIFFQVFSKEYINLLVTFYFFVLGVIALSHVLSCLIKASVKLTDYTYCFKLSGFKKNNSTSEEENSKEIVKIEFDNLDIVALVISSLLGIWYLIQKHWLANNLFGLAFAVNAIEMLQLNKISTGLILLGGLFIYDIFWVFGTNVMVSVAKSFDAPIKLMFPLDVLEKGFFASNYAMLGLGDIVIPGIFIALILRFEYSLMKKKDTKDKKSTYFNATLLAYTLGLLFTTVILHFFKHAQPALLYLVPACVGTPFALATYKNELSHLLSYEDNEPQQPKELNDSEKETSIVSDSSKKID